MSSGGKVDDGRRPPGAVTPRALILGSLLIVANAVIVAWMEAVKAGGRTTTFSLFFLAVFDLLVLVGVNRVVARVRPRWALSTGELLVLYAMMNVGIALAGIDMLQVLVPLMAYPTARATPENRWDSLFLDVLPSWLAVKDPRAAALLYTGHASFWSPEVLRAWLVPVACWTGFVLVLLWVLLCLGVLFRKQWVEGDRLSFPLVTIPLTMVEERGALFRHRGFWAAFAAAALIHTVNSLHVLSPGIPEIPVNARSIQGWFGPRPWSAVGTTHLSFFPWAIGLGYLLPADLLFSSWFFYWALKLERVATTAYGLTVDNPNMPYVAEQGLGGYLGISVMVLWLARRHLAAVARAAWSGKGDDAGEALSYRTALFGGAAGVALLAAFARAGGMAWGTAAIYLGIFLAVSITVARMRAEFGAPVHDFQYDPGSLLVMAGGASAFGRPELGAFALFYWFTRAQRANILPIQLESLRMAEHARVTVRGMAGALMLAALVGTLAGFAALLDPYYRLGLGSAKVLGPHAVFTNEAYNQLASRVSSPPPPQPVALAFVGLGAAITAALSVARLNLVGFPLHPVGFAVAASWNMSLLWMPLLIAWGIKLALLRSGGLPLYRAGLPLFLGLLLGDFTSMALWNLAGMLWNFPVYGLYAS